MFVDYMQIQMSGAKYPRSHKSIWQRNELTYYLSTLVNKRIKNTPCVSRRNSFFLVSFFKWLAGFRQHLLFCMHDLSKFDRIFTLKSGLSYIKHSFWIHTLKNGSSMIAKVCFRLEYCYIWHSIDRVRCIKCSKIFHTIFYQKLSYSPEYLDIYVKT